MLPFLDTVCRAYLLFLSVYHVISGVMSFFCPERALSFYRKLYDCNPVERKHLAIVLRPWGALAAFAGVAGLFAAADPRRYAGVVVGLAILQAARITYRLWCRRELAGISGIAPHRNMISIAVILVGLLLLTAWLAAFMRAP